MMAQRPTDPHLGREIAGYRIDELIGRGGMGLVYRAEHLRLGRSAAIKLIAPEFASSGSFRERFMREARVAASLHHAHIVTVYDAGEQGDLLWIAMQHVDGSDLGAILGAHGALPGAAAIDLCSQVAGALDAAHAVGLIHRDVKPANVLVAGTHAYLTDFGLTTRAQRAGRRPRNIVGTLHYCAPEQIEDEGVDARSDVYALGCLLYQCLTGQVPFPRDSDEAVIHAHLHEPPPALAPDLPEPLGRVIARALEKDPARRHPGCRELMDAATAAWGARAGDGLAAISGRIVPAAGDAAGMQTRVDRMVPAAGDRPSVYTRAPGDVGPQRGDRARILLGGAGTNTRAVTRVALGPHVDLREAEGAGAVARAARDQRPDLLLLDISQSGSETIEGLRRVRADPVTRDARVVVVIDWDEPARAAIAAAGADAMLTVPLTSLQLQVQVRQLLGAEALSE